MIEKMIEAFSFDKLFQDVENIKIHKENNYLEVYKEFIQYFKNLSIISTHNIIIGISFTYSRMPTILNFNGNNIKSVAIILNNAKKGIRPNLGEITILKNCFNNSLVGSSKLLHFINPEQFAIWDSRVCRYLLQKTPHSYIVENIDLYLDYLSFCDYLIKDNKTEELQKIVEEKIGYKISKMRAIELIFFYNGSKK